jgi:hypothetical protein
MGQHLSRLQDRHAALPKSSYLIACDSTLVDDDVPTFAQYENIPDIDDIPATSVAIDSLAEPDKRPRIDNSKDISKGTKKKLDEIYKAREISIASPSSSYPSYEPTASALIEAQHQYRTGRGLFWSLAVLKLSPHFLHPVDLTASEFLAFVTTADVDSWLLTHRPKLLHRVITRRADAQRALKLAGIPHRQLRGIEMFELMDKDGRRAFIAEYHRRMKDILESMHGAMDTDIIPLEASSSLQVKDATTVKEMDTSTAYDEKDKNPGPNRFHGKGSLPTYSSKYTSRDKTLRKRRSVFESLGELFSRNTPINSNVHAHDSKPRCSDDSGTPSSHTNCVTWGPETPRFSMKLRGSVHSFRHLFERKNRAFKRAGIGEHVFVE